MYKKLLQMIEKDRDNRVLYDAVYSLVVDGEYSNEKEKWQITKKLKEYIASSSSEEIQSMYSDILLIEARGLRFDSYMLYMEIKREPSKRFWLPRRKCLLPLVERIQRLIDFEVDKLAISMPPGTGKSTLEIFLLSMLIGANPNEPCLSSGHSGVLTTSLYDGVLGLITDKDEYTWSEIFPEASKIITDAKETTIDVGKQHRFKSLTCRSIDGSLTGATRCTQLLSADDLVKGIEEAVSIVRLDKLWSKVTNDLMSRRMGNCRQLYLGTRWSVHDPIGRLIQKYEGDDSFEAYRMPALDENEESNFDYDYGCGFSTAYFLDMKKNLDEVSWRCLYQNEPIEREGLLFPVETLKRYYELPAEEPDAIVGVCDTKDKGSDYCVQVIGRIYGDNVYISDVICTDSTPEMFTERLATHLINQKVQKCKYESNAAGGVLALNVQKILRSNGCGCSIQTAYTTQNKETKIFANSDWVKEHCYFKGDELDTEYKKFIEMLCTYTHMGRNAHDDAPDAMSMLALYIQSFTRTKVKVFERPF